MISSADVPACSACGSREVHPVRQLNGPTLFACRGCGRDQTDAWAPLQAEQKPEPRPILGDPDPVEPPHRLGIGATVPSSFANGPATFRKGAYK